MSTRSELANEHREIPPYPYGPAKLYKKGNFGLYAGARVRYGNIVSKGRWVRKVRRKWWPNVQQKRIYSDALGKFIRTKVTTRVLRTIDKVGGLDNYLLGNTSARIKDLGMKGWALRWKIMQTNAIKEKFSSQKQELGMATKDFQKSEEELAKLEQAFAEEVQSRPTVKQRAVLREGKQKRRDVWLNPPELDTYSNIMKSELAQAIQLAASTAAAKAVIRNVNKESNTKEGANAISIAEQDFVRIARLQPRARIRAAEDQFREDVRQELANMTLSSGQESRFSAEARAEARQSVLSRYSAQGNTDGAMVAAMFVEHGGAKLSREEWEQQKKLLRRKLVQQEIEKFENIEDLPNHGSKNSDLAQFVKQNPNIWEAREKAIRNSLLSSTA